MRSPRAVAAVAVTGLLFGAPAAAQSGRDTSGAELRDLAARAADDPAALARLRQVERVDGVPMAIDVAVGDVSGEALRSRLAVLATASSAEPAPSAGEARDDAARILEQARYREPAQPRPLRGLFRWVGERLQPIIEPLAPLGRPFAAAWRAVTAGGGWSLLAGGVVAVIAALASLRLVRRRGRRLAAVRQGHRGHARGLDPDQLERDADGAEAAGRFDEAFRLRFLAGLVRLDRAGIVELRPSLTSGALRRRVPSLQDLTLSFEEIVYGGRAAGPEDVDRSRRDWPRALEQVGS